MSTTRQGLAATKIRAAIAACVIGMSGAAALAQPVEIRMGVGTSSEEQAWLMKARPDLTPNQGKAYTYKMSMFRSGNDRMVAFQAGQLDALTSSSTGILFAASKGVPLLVPVSMARESTQTFSTSYFSLADSGISLANLKGKTIGINGYRTSIELYARIAVAKAGLDPERDVKWLVVPLPQMAEALRQKKIDIGVFPSTFAFAAMKEGGVQKVFDSAGISGIEEEFDIAFSPQFARKHPDAARAWVSDFLAVTKYVEEKPQEARKSLLDAKIVQLDPAIYQAMTSKDDLLRTVAAATPNVEMFRRLQDELLKAKFQESPVDIGKLIDTSFLPKSAGN
jgi:ABC-type nitrate/sulfonate/bicarbonate transport system substrate-binding protein